MLANALRPAVQSLCRKPFFEAEFGRNHDSLANGLQSLAHDLFVEIWTIRFRGIEKCHAAVEGRPDERDRLLPLCRRAVAKAEPHASQPQGRNLKPAFSQNALLHVSILLPRLQSLRRINC